MSENQEVLVKFDNFHNPETTLQVLKSLGGSYVKSIPEENAAVISIYFTKVGALNTVQGVASVSFYGSDPVPAVPPNALVEPPLPVSDVLPVVPGFDQSAPV